MNIVLISLGIISIAYDAVLIMLNPGTLPDNIFSFTHIWLALGALLIFLGIYRNKTGHSFWKILKTELFCRLGRSLKEALVTVIGGKVFVDEITDINRMVAPFSLHKAVPFRRILLEHNKHHPFCGRSAYPFAVSFSADSFNIPYIILLFAYLSR